MTWIALRLLFNAWLVGSALLFINSASHALFSRAAAPRKLRRIGSAALLAPVWPLAVFSPSGRRILFNKLNQL